MSEAAAAREEPGDVEEASAVPRRAPVGGALAQLLARMPPDRGREETVSDAARGRVAPAEPGLGGEDRAAWSALQHYLVRLRPWLDQPGVTEVCINRPAEVFVEDGIGWRRAEERALDYAWCLGFVRLVAAYTQQRIDPERPLLSAALPSGERVQAVMPPATRPGHIAVALRKPSAVRFTLAKLAARGAFESTRRGRDERDRHDGAASSSSEGSDVEDLLRRAVRERLNILVSGATGSGKTTLTRALIEEIPPHERLVTIEDAAELSLDSHPNSVRLFYSKDGQGLAKVTAKQLLAASLRLRPDRILLAELRGEEAYDYLRNVNSGHPGSITSIHASSCALAFEQLTLLVKESAAGREMRREDVRALLEMTVDVVVQCGRNENGRRGVREVWFR